MRETAAIPSTCELAWTAGATGWTRLDADMRVIGASDPNLVGASWHDVPGVIDVFGDDLAHVLRYRCPLVVRRLWHRRVWESTFFPVTGGVRIVWRCLLELPDDLGESISRWLAVGRSVLEALEGDATPVPAARAAVVTPGSAAASRLRVV